MKDQRLVRHFVQVFHKKNQQLEYLMELSCQEGTLRYHKRDSYTIERWHSEFPVYD
jgi:hypothetical protein